MACGDPSSLEHAPLDGFSDAQKQYLQQLLDELDLAAVFKPAPAANAPISVYGTPLEDLCSQEVTKLENPPAELYPQLEEIARTDEMPVGGDVFNVKHAGLFNVQPAQPGFMCRLRIPSCKLTAAQLAGLGELSEKVGGGYLHVTTRGNLQIREIPARAIIDLLEGLYDLGLTCKGSGADSVRNVTCNPTAGFDPQELIDLSRNGINIHQHILHTPSLHGIPRKFNIAFDGGGLVSAVVDTNDLAFVAHRMTDDALAANPELARQLEDAGHPGVVLRILLGGITGHLDFAVSNGFACLPSQTTQVCDAVLRVFIEHGDRTNRKKARLKYLLDDWGHVKFTEEVERRLPFELLRLPADATELRGPIDRTAHVGVHPQTDPTKRWLGVALRTGHLPREIIKPLADVAKTYGSGDVRLTVWQNVILPDVPAERVDDAVAALQAIGLDVDASSFVAGAVACTGKTGCQYASAHTKETVNAAASYLQGRFTLDSPINMHFTGCGHSCAQHYIGDIGAVGASTEDGRDAFNFYLGGGTEHDQGIARYLAGPIAVEDINGFLEQIVGRYLELRTPGQTFLDFTRTLADDELEPTFLAPATAAA